MNSIDNLLFLAPFAPGMPPPGMMGAPPFPPPGMAPPGGFPGGM